jgi:TonB family protein
MRHTSWICVLVALLASGVLAQEAETPEKPAQAETATVAVAPDNAQQLSEKDRLLACPANIQLHADMRTTVEGESLSNIGESVKPPKVTNQVAAMFSDEARRMAKKKHLKSFQSIITLIVDVQGNPQHVCVLKPAGYELDGEAVKAVNKYQFKPATKEDGTPVPVRITVKVDFRLY